jgi:hypothetical protein
LSQIAEQPSASGSPAAPDSGSIEVLPGVIGTPPSSESSYSPSPSFEAGPSPSLGGGATAADAASTPAAPVAEPAPAPSKFTFAGVEFDDQAAAEHSVKTLRGMYKAHERKVEQARIALLEEQQRRLELERRFAQLESQSQRANVQQTPNGQPAGDQAGNADGQPDWAVFNELSEKFGLPTAMRWLQQVNAEQVNSRVTKAVEEAAARFEERLAPLHASFAEQQEERGAAELLQSMTAYRDQAGREAYPELRDPEALYQIGLIGRRMNLPREFLLSHQGMHTAIAVYRDAMALRAAGVSAGAATATSPAQASPAAAAAAVGNSAEAPVPTRPPQPQSEGDRLRAEIMAAAVSTNDLGFA